MHHCLSSTVNQQSSGDGAAATKSQLLKTVGANCNKGRGKIFLKSNLDEVKSVIVATELETVSPRDSWCEPCVCSAREAEKKKHGGSRRTQTGRRANILSLSSSKRIFLRDCWGLCRGRRPPLRIRSALNFADTRTSVAYHKRQQKKFGSKKNLIGFAYHEREEGQAV